MAHSPEGRYVRWRTTALVVWSVIGGLVLAAAVLWVLGRLMPAFAPFLVAFVIVFLLNTPVAALAKRGMKRSHAALLCLVVGLTLLGGVITLLGPTIGQQLSSFGRSVPGYLSQVAAAESAVEGQLSALVLPPWFGDIIRSASTQLSQFVVVAGNNLARGVLSFGGGVARAIVDLFLATIIAFWIMADLPKLREEITLLAGPRYEGDAEHLLFTVTRVLGGYLRGQTIASASTGALTMIGLSLFHVPYAIVMGIIAFILNYAPYIGPVTTALMAGMLGLLVSPWTAVAAVAVVIVAQNFTDAVITPRVMSDQVDLHPTLVIFSLLVGGTLFGIAGLLLAIPVAAIAKGLFVYYWERRTERQLSSTNGALFRHSAGSSPTADTAVVQRSEPTAENAEQE